MLEARSVPGGSGDYFEGVLAKDPIGVEVAVQSKDSTKAQPLSRCDQGSVREIHGGVGVLPHEVTHSHPFFFFSNMDSQKSIRAETPQLVLGPDSPSPSQKVHRFREAGPSSQERG